MPVKRSPWRTHRPPRRGWWTQVGLWLLLALLPLRGLASVEMLTMSAAGSSAVHAPSLAGMPACHGIVTHEDAQSQDAPAGSSLADGAHVHGDPPAAVGDTVCVWSLLCAPALPGAGAALPGLPPAGGASPVHGAGAAPDVVLEPLFKPPRG